MAATNCLSTKRCGAKPQNRFFLLQLHCLIYLLISRCYPWRMPLSRSFPGWFQSGPTWPSLRPERAVCKREKSTASSACNAGPTLLRTKAKRSSKAGSPFSNALLSTARWNRVLHNLISCATGQIIALLKSHRTKLSEHKQSLTRQWSSCDSNSSRDAVAPEEHP